MTEQLGHNVEVLGQAVVEGLWEDIGLDKFSLDSCIAAVHTLVPGFPCTREELDKLLATGTFHLRGVRWPNGLRGVIAWAGDYEWPPAECIQAAYERAWQALEHLRERPDDFAAKLALFDMKVGGNA